MLSKKPPTGKKITFLQCSQPVCTAFMAGLKEASAVLGWTVKAIPFEQTPEGIQAGVQAAIDSKPDGIFFTGISPAFITKQLADAKAKGIPIVDGFDAATKFAFPIIAMVGGARDTHGLVAEDGRLGHRRLERQGERRHLQHQRLHDAEQRDERVHRAS